MEVTFYRGEAGIWRAGVAAWENGRFPSLRTHGQPADRAPCAGRPNSPTRGTELRYLPGQPLQAEPAVSARRRPAAGDRKADRRGERRAGFPDAPRRHRVGQDLHDGQRDCPARPSGHGARAEQDARGAAVLRDARVLPGKLRRVLRFLLRLLPAGSLCAGAGPVHREGLLDQRAHRADATFGNQVADGTPRCRDRGDGLGDLRHRRPGRIPHHDPPPAGGREVLPA